MMNLREINFLFKYKKCEFSIIKIKNNILKFILDGDKNNILIIDLLS